MIGRAVADGLGHDGYAVDWVRDGPAAELSLKHTPYDAAVLDLGLPVKSGIAVLDEWRGAGRTLPVLILTARDGWSDKVEGFRAGADDYLTKPFRVEELVMRLRALGRRAAGHAAPRVVCGPLSFDAQTGQFELDGLPLRLTALEWRVLSALILRKESVIERLDLLDRVYENDADPDSNSLEVIVARLRRKIGRDLIETVRGRGYRLTADQLASPA